MEFVAVSVAVTTKMTNAVVPIAVQSPAVNVYDHAPDTGVIVFVRPAKASVNVALVSTDPETTMPAFFSAIVMSLFPPMAESVTTGGTLSILQVTL